MNRMNIFITSPSRVGSNWICDILVDLIKPTTVLRLYSIKHLFMDRHKPPRQMLKKLDSLKGNNVFKIHRWKPEDLLGIVKGKIIGMVRNYNDSVDSLMAWIKKKNNLDISLDELKKERKNQIKNHKDMYDSMKIQNKRYLLIHYEDLIKRPMDTIKSICKFLRIRRDIEDLEDIINLNRYMYKKQTIQDDTLVNNYMRR